MKKNFILYNSYKNIIKILSKNEKLKFNILIISSLIIAFFEMFSVAGIMPYISMAIDPGLIHKNYYLNEIYTLFGFVSKKDFIITIGILYTLLILLFQFLKFQYYFYQTSFIYTIESAIAIRLFNSNLKNQYRWFLDKHSAKLSKSILSEVAEVVHYSIAPFLLFVSNLFITLLVSLLLFLINPLVYFSFFSIIFLINLIIQLLIKSSILTNSAVKVSSNEARFRAIFEAFGSIKELKLYNNERLAISAFKTPSINFARANTAIQNFSLYPKSIMETIGYTSIILFVIYLIDNNLSLNNYISILSLSIFALFRLIPSTQLVFSSLNKIRFNSNELFDLSHSFNKLSNQRIYSNLFEEFQDLTISNLTFSYKSKVETPTLNNINFTFCKGEKIGIIGASGQGKTTFFEILLGLLYNNHENTGEFVINGIPLTNTNIHEWQSIISYTPQSIYLNDATIAENIAFGQNINYELLDKVTRISDIYDFIHSELDKGYQTVVGERGIFLSGGQKQRIGLARALYRNPKVLFLDEATSALDEFTETKVITNLFRESKDMSIIMVAHRTSTLRNCDRIYELKNGFMNLK
jgi:ABC-type multidrug transport system fused ATPase/permease subunit